MIVNYTINQFVKQNHFNYAGVLMFLEWGGSGFWVEGCWATSG